MNVSEERFWRVLIELGAKETMIGGKHALDLSPIRVTNKNKLGLFIQAVVGVVGRSNANRRHVDRRGCPIYVVTDFYTLDKATAPQIRTAEDRAFKERLRRQKENAREE